MGAALKSPLPPFRKGGEISSPLEKGGNWPLVRKRGEFELVSDTSGARVGNCQGEATPPRASALQSAGMTKWGYCRNYETVSDIGALKFERAGSILRVRPPTDPPCIQ